MYHPTHQRCHLRRSETDLVLDVYANTGQFAPEMFNAGFADRINCFEPLSSVHDVLSDTAQSSLKWEAAPRRALGNTVGSAVIDIAGNSFSSSSRPTLEAHLMAASESAYIGTETTSVETPANVVTRRFPEGARRFASKIDTPRFENEALEGLRAHIEQCSDILHEIPLDSPNGDAVDLPTPFSRLIKLSFRCVGLSPGHKNPWIKDAVEADGLFVRDGSTRPQAFPLFTSVPPFLSGEALTRQRAVIASWRAGGFKPISVNGPSEVEQLATLCLDIEIERASEDGKPLLGDIVAAIRKSGCRCAGIVNADCKLIDYPNLSRTLAAALENSVLYAERVDVSDDCAPAVGECNGFDAFFFDVGMLGMINDRHFRLGETWWDYWFPLQLAVNGAMLGNIGVPLIYHRRHQARWDDEQWLRHGRYMFSALKKWEGQNAPVPIFSWLAGSDRLSTPDIHRLSMMSAACFQWLRSRKLPREVTFLPNEMSGIEALIQDAYRGFASAGDLATTKAELTAAKAELTAAKAELGAFQASTFWRFTAPLRDFVTFLRRNAGRSFSTAAK